MNITLIFTLFLIVFLSSCKEEKAKINLPIVEICQFELGYLNKKEIELNLPFEADYSYNSFIGWSCSNQKPFIEEIRGEYFSIRVSHKYNKPEIHDDQLFDYYENEIDTVKLFDRICKMETTKNRYVDNIIQKFYFVVDNEFDKVINSGYQTSGEEIISIHHDYTKVSNTEYLSIYFSAFLEYAPPNKSIKDIKDEITFILENFKEYN